MYDEEMQINSATLCSISITPWTLKALKNYQKKKVWRSHKSERCNQWGHSTCLPSSLPVASFGASKSEGNLSRNTSSNFLSIARVPCAQVRLSYCSRHVSGLCSSFFVCVLFFLFLLIKCPSVDFCQRLLVKFTRLFNKLQAKFGQSKMGLLNLIKSFHGERLILENGFPQSC